MARRTRADRARAGVDYLVRGGFSYWSMVALDRAGAAMGPIWRLYRRAAPAVYRRLFGRRLRQWSDPPDPLAIRWVDPDAISSFTRRTYPPWEFRENQFGRVAAGDWDVRSRIPVRDGYVGPPKELYLAETIEESPIHRGLEERYVDGIPWADTEFVSRVREVLDDRSPAWHECYSEADLPDRFAALDRLYDSMSREGYLSQLTLIDRGVKRPEGYLRALADEVTVDVGRRGDLLLVNGRHRLSIAKILDIDRIPVAILYRHEKWMRHRTEDTVKERHPDRPGSEEATTTK